MGLTLLLAHPLKVCLRSTLCETEMVPQDNRRRMILQHLGMGENHRGVGASRLRLRAPNRLQHEILVYLYVFPRSRVRLLGSGKTCTLQCDFSASLVPEWPVKDQHFHEDMATATWMNGDASAPLPPLWSLCLQAASCSLPQQCALLGTAAAIGMGAGAKKAGWMGWNNEEVRRKKVMVISST